MNKAAERYFKRKLKTAVNHMIDGVFHPHFKHPTAIILDTIAHAINEQNPKSSARKFVKYNLHPLARAILKGKEKDRKKGV